MLSWNQLPTLVCVTLSLIQGLPASAGVLTDEERAVLATDPGLRRVLESRTDVWGEAAMRRPNGPSYEFFADLLPPPRYVNAVFRHYPIVLSAPRARAKARLVSNGSAINALAGHERWFDAGLPVTFQVDGAGFGQDIRYLDGPRYLRGYLPVVQMAYTQSGANCEEEVFAPTEAPYADRGTVFVRFTARGRPVTITALVGGEDGLTGVNGELRSALGVVLQRSPEWTWDAARRTLSARLPDGQSAELATFTQPLSSPVPPLDYDRRRRQCVRTWESFLARGMRIRTPEPLVDNVWRSHLIGTMMLVKGNLICYSNGNQYEKIYINEGGDAIRALLMWGYADEVRPMILPWLDFSRAGLLFHQAALKLQLMSHYYWLTRDAGFLREQRARWMPQVERIMNGREPESGLFPREKYCGDIETLVYSLNSNANSWRGLRDMAEVLKETGDDAHATMRSFAGDFRKSILAAVGKSVRRDVQPPFVPIALFADEQPYEALTATRLGGYYDLMAPLVLGSGALGDDSEQTGWMLKYLQQHGGLCMGMMRSHPANVMYTVKQGTNNLYTLRYLLTLLRRDDAEHAMVTFYGKLAQGMTRGTFIDGETTGLVPLDEHGRPTYMPPNSAANAFYLQMLRYMLVQDWDMDDDGRPDTLRLMFATPKRWLEDGKAVSVERAPTAFGEVSVSLQSRLSEGRILAKVTAPPRAPERTLLRVRLPDGWKAVSASRGGSRLPLDQNATADVTAMRDSFTVVFEVTK